MKHFILLMLLFVCLGQASFAQQDSLLLLLEKEQDTTVTLLPKRMMVTQSLLWGRKGLFRVTGLSPITEKARTRELKIRRRMLIAHQVLGYLTLGGMIGQGIIGQRLYNGNFDLQKAHKTLGSAVSISYFTTASLSLFAPPPMLNRSKQKRNTIRWHKYLAFLHMGGMITTLVLADKASDPRYKPYHRAAAFTAFGAFATSMIVIAF